MGGTNIAAGLLDAKCRILSRDKRPTLARLGVEKVIARIIGAITKVVAKGNVDFSQIRGVGIASPGVLDTQKGVVITAFNLPSWKRVPLKEIIEKKLKLPVVIGHDAAMAALGEKHYGAGIKASNLVCVTIGTGVGIGIIIDGKLYERSTGDLGHMIVDRNGPRCNCGDYGCLERLVGGPRIAAIAREKVKKGAHTLISKLSGNNADRIEAKTVFDAAKKGDKTALGIVEYVGEMLGIGITNVVVILNPELVVIGGMIAKAGDILFDRVKKAMAARAWFEGLEKRIVPAKLGADAGIMGAACLVMEKL